MTKVYVCVDTPPNRQFHEVTDAPAELTEEYIASLQRFAKEDFPNKPVTILITNV